MNRMPAPGGARQRRGLPPAGQVVELDRLRIERALAQRRRYRYVHPRVERDGAGWKVVSPNCSRRIDPAGGEIAIAWLLPAAAGRWLLHARDHAGQRWRLEATCASLADALQCIRLDPQRIFWP